MLTDEQVIQRLRDALESEAAGIDPQPRLHARIHQELLTAPPSDRAYRWRRPGARLRLPNLGSVVTALASVSAVVVAVVAIATLGHSRSSPRRGARGPVTLAALEARLAVLRRPQTSADRLPHDLARAAARSGHAVIISRLTRLAVVLDTGPRREVRVYVIVEKPAARRIGGRGGSVMPRAGYRVSSVASWTVARGNRYSYGGGVGALVVPPVAARCRSISPPGCGFGAQLPGDPGNVRRLRGVDMSIVPDGVTHVDWIFGDPFGSTKLIQPAVEDNVAAAKVPPNEGYLSSAMWYGAGGRLIASFDDQAEVARQEVARARAIGRHTPIASSLMRRFAVFRSPPPPPAVRRALPFMLARGAVLSNFMGLNVDQARFVPYPGAPSRPGTGPGIWLIPGTSGVSLYDGSASVGNPFSIVYEEGGLILTTTTGGDEASTGGLHPGGKSRPATGGQGTQTVGGLVADGNVTVAVQLAGGAVRKIPGVDNVFSITVSGHARVVAVIAQNSAGRKVTFH